MNSFLYRYRTWFGALIVFALLVIAGAAVWSIVALIDVLRSL